MDDQELTRLLGEWKAPDAPPGLLPKAPHGWWPLSWATASIRVPVPVALVALVLVGAWAAWTWQAPPTTHQATESRPTSELVRYPLTGPLAGFDAVLVEVNFGPGVLARQHRHPSFILGYVVDGQMRFGINHEPDHVVPPGGTFFEPPGALHTTFGSASSDAATRAVVFLVVPTGSPVTGPA